MQRPLQIGMVAGEASGDVLGAALMQAMRGRLPDVTFFGVAGDRMRAAGCEALGSSEELAVMGLVEPLRHLPRLFRLRSRILQACADRRVDLFIGIDSPAFNLGLARRLRDRGTPAVQYVSPQVWAWRKGRVRSIARAVDAVLCLLPFEPAAYAGQPVRAEFIGHPMADAIAPGPWRQGARAALGIAADATVVAILPGSREGEIRRLGADFVRTAQLLQQRHSRPVQFIAPMASALARRIFTAQVNAAGASLRLLDGEADLALAASDAALVASGTATLQALLHGVPMVVAYRLAPLTAFIVRDLGLVKLRHFSLPNLLAGEALVPEFFQEAVVPRDLAAALDEILGNDSRRRHLQQRFHALHQQLRRGAADRAAQIVCELVTDGRQNQS
jgi:lipid-A-disaccharide synthase